ncbi:hypothetical protein F5Y16DRAFT_402493 [Xylariaceae sp. FL0255]|nr:hypothetical protein F5Y16DRAFT_402493 [Xylariaceae sp. FL0255]
MRGALGLNTHELNTLASLFYVGYIVFQFPSDMFMKKITPPVQLGFALISWGTFTALVWLPERLGFGTAAPAGAFNGIISYGIIENLDSAIGIPAWKWIFLIKGVITIVLGFIIFLLLPGAPEKIRWGWTA